MGLSRRASTDGAYYTFRSLLDPRLQVNALQRHSLERELHILDRVRHGAIIRAGAIVEDDAGSDNPIPMLYIEVGVFV